MNGSKSPCIVKTWQNKKEETFERFVFQFHSTYRTIYFHSLQNAQIVFSTIYLMPTIYSNIINSLFFPVSKRFDFGNTLESIANICIVRKSSFHEFHRQKLNFLFDFSASCEVFSRVYHIVP